MNVQIFETVYEYLTDMDYTFDQFEKHAYNDDAKYTIENFVVTSDEGCKTTPENENIEQTITLNGSEYQYINCGEKEVSYVKADNAFESVFVVAPKEGHRYNFEFARVFETEEEAEEYISKN